MVIQNAFRLLFLLVTSDRLRWVRENRDLEADRLDGWTVKRLFRLKHGKKLNIFHAMSAGVSSEMKNIRERGGDMIEYLDYYGHSKNFVVRLKGMERMVRNVKSFCDLEDKVGQLSSLKV